MQLGRWRFGGRSAQPLDFPIVQHVFESLLLQVGSKGLGIDGIPPTVRALNNDVQVVGIDVTIMFLAVIANEFSNVVLHLGSNGMFRGIHVRNLCPPKPLGELFPGVRFDIVVLSNIETPNVAGGRLQDS